MEMFQSKAFPFNKKIINWFLVLYMFTLHKETNGEVEW